MLSARRRTGEPVLFIFIFIFILHGIFLCAPVSGGRGRCKLLRDQTRGPSAGVTNDTYAGLLGLMNNTFGLEVDNIIPQGDNLNTTDYEGVGLLWLDAKYSGNDSNAYYDFGEQTAIQQFVRVSNHLLFLFLLLFICALCIINSFSFVSVQSGGNILLMLGRFRLHYILFIFPTGYF